ncbi:MAG: alpha-amylase family glycosyl hydrolase [Acutalibacteraceae bacterium]|nr:alpha-amylase family glycosyl hydrolase [Acutalibacteraceae bacterium]
MLKKVLSVTLVACLCASVLSACGKDSAGGSSAGDQANTSTGEIQPLKAVQSTDNYRNYYQIFVHSFCDSNGDEIGDIPGITSKLDYLNDGNPEGGDDLGIDGIWLTPICKSKSYHKYSVEDYCLVDENFGTNDDFKKLIEGCNERGISVITDLVINHSSDLHPWFVQACEEVKQGNLDGYAKYYHFVKAEEKDSESQYYNIPDTEYFYEANFDSSMPELNVSNEKVREEIKNIMQFWFDMGVAGFRLDAIKYYNTGGDDGIEFLTWFMKTAKEIKEDCYIIGENWWGSSQIIEWYQSGIDSQFNFPMSQADGHFANAARSGNVAKLCTALESWGNQMAEAQPNAINASFLSNHDMARSGAGLGKDLKTQKQAAMLYMFAPGNSFTYYGEELALLGSTNNDGSYRLPMPWDGTEWEKIHLPSISFEVAENAVTTTAEEAVKDENSLFKTYQEIIKLKLQNPEIARGKITDVIETDNNYGTGFVTKYNDSGVIIFFNASQTETVTADISKDLLNYSGICGQVTAQDKTGGTEPAKATLNGTTLTVPPATTVIIR